MSFRETEFGLIPKMWEICELKDKVEITMGQSPKSEFYNADGKGIPFMQGRTAFGEKYHSIDTWCTDPKKYAKKNDVLMSVRAPVGDVNIAKMDLCIGRGLASLRMKNKNNEFLYYLLKNYVDIIVSRESGTVFGSINKLGIESLKLPFPNDKEQKAIAHILTTLDEKIETNNQINKKLEEIAQSIFKQWFVNFEFPTEEGVPYKLSGGEFHSQNGIDSPIEWKISNVFDNVQLVKDKNKNNEDFPVLTVVKEGRFLCSEEYFTKQVYSKDTSNYKIVDKYDIAYNPSRANIGSIAMLKEFDRGLVSPMYVVFRLGEKILPFYFDYYMRLPGFIERIALNSSGTTRQNFDFNAFKDFTLIIPPMDIQERAYKIIKSIEDLINKNVKENEKLKDIRDTLLPKLMSSEVRVLIKFKEN